MTASPPRHAVVIEDDPQIRRFLRTVLPGEGFDVFEAETAERGLVEAATRKPDVVILDLGLPDMDGAEVIRRLREWSPVPIVVLSARTREQDKVVALDAGADDYLAKPFGVRELVARVRALLRRPRASQIAPAASTSGVPPDVLTSERPVHVHGIEVDPARRRVRVRGEEVELTAQEFRLLYLLASHPGIVFSREALLSRVWPDHTFVTLRSVDTLIKRLRRRVEVTPGEPSLILTIWGSGYKFADV
jgi:two-component system KDP operon response regulator KdpE